MYLSFRPEILNTYIFRKPVKTSSGHRMGTERLTQDMVSKWISTMGMLSGFEHSTMAYDLRYMAGNSLDRNGMSQIFATAHFTFVASLMSDTTQ